MQISYQVIGIIAGILSLVGYVPYIISMLRGITKPNRATWVVWTIIGGLLAFSYIASGNRDSIWLPLGYFIGPFIIMILSIKYGYATWTRVDSYCLVAALFSVIPWFLTHNAILTLLINIFIDAAGAIPTLIKTYYEPETEDFVAWFIFLIANTMQLFAIESWDLSASYPVYLFFLASTMVFFILKEKIFRLGAKKFH